MDIWEETHRPAGNQKETSHDLVLRLFHPTFFGGRHIETIDLEKSVATARKNQTKLLKNSRRRASPIRSRNDS
jgi:hypothetical protein